MTPLHVPSIETFEVDVPRGVEFEPHVHEWHELIWGARGRFVVEAGSRSWLLAPSLGVWVPAGVVHGGFASAGASYCGAKFDPARSPIRWTAPTVVPVSPLLAELLRSLHNDPLTSRARWHAEHLAMTLLTPLSSASALPMPSDGRLCAVTHHLLTDPADDRSLEEWGRAVGASARTLTRLFLAETGMSFTRWRAQARVRSAMQHLADGATTAQAARMAGYATISAFVRVFKQVTGTPPQAYVAAHHRVEPPAAEGWHPPERIQLVAG